MPSLCRRSWETSTVRPGRRLRGAVGIVAGAGLLCALLARALRPANDVHLVDTCAGASAAPGKAIRLLLTPFSPSAADRDLQVAAAARVSPDNRDLVLVYELKSGSPLQDFIDIPADGTPLDPTRLWEHTCPELFVSRGTQHSYIELNLSPSGAQFGRSFIGYRAGERADQSALPVRARVIERSSHGLALQARIRLNDLLPSGLLWPLFGRTSTEAHLGISFVVRHNSASAVRHTPADPSAARDSEPSFSFYAVKHAGKEADFHNRESFCLKVRKHNR